MTFRRATLPLLAALAVTAGFQTPAAAQRGSTPAQRAENVRAAAALRGRIQATDARITAAQRSGKITPSRATALHRQIAQTQTSMTRLSRQQSFVSAAEFASYERTLAAIDVQLDNRGVERSYGNDGLVASSADQGLRYDCRNEPIAVAIPGDRLEAALQRLRLTTRCPISGTDLARGKRSKPVVGTMTPSAALQAMLNGTGLEGNAIKGGFQITRLPR